MSSATRLPPGFRLLLVALALLALVRGLGLVLHRPMLAFANNYDQIRYTACLDLAPWRPGVQADRGNPQAPLARYAFQPLPQGTCILTSDLLFSAPVAFGWHLAERLGGREIHSIHRLGELRLLAWFLLAAWATAALLRAGRADIAIVHLAWFALVGMDPANLLYFSTFYAEAAALFGFYACGVGIVVALLRPTRTALGIAAFGALLLATAKFQHLLLPLLLGFALLFAAGQAGRKVALAVIVGGALGCALQVGDALRDVPMARGVNIVNRIDFVLSVLLPETSDRAHVAQALDLEAECLAYAGKSVYAMPKPSEQICTRVNHWPRTLPWWLLISDPPALGRALMHLPKMLLPWIPALGVVEEGNYAPLPRALPSWSGWFGESHAVAGGLLLLPWLVFAMCLVRRAAPAARGFALMCAAGSAGVALVSLFGDGDVEYGKHAHLAIDYALASACVPLLAILSRRRSVGVSA
jgi:hypothetical protein